MSSRTSTSSEVWVTAQCDTCGRIDLRPHEFTVLRGEACTTYTYVCPLCCTLIRRPASDAVLAVITIATARATHHETPEARRGAA